jgi:hypothetical protein
VVPWLHSEGVDLPHAGRAVYQEGRPKAVQRPAGNERMSGAGDVPAPATEEPGHPPGRVIRCSAGAEFPGVWAPGPPRFRACVTDTVAVADGRWQMECPLEKHRSTASDPGGFKTMRAGPDLQSRGATGAGGGGR